MKVNAILRLIIALALFALAISCTNVVTIILGALAIAWAWWKDAPITIDGQIGHLHTKQLKELRNEIMDEVDEPEDSEVIE